MSEISAATRARVESLCRARHFQHGVRERWLALDDEDAEALLHLGESLRLGENQLRDLFDWAEEIAVRDDSRIAAVLAAEPIAVELRRGLGRNEALRAVREAMRRLRFPQLAAMEERLAERIRALGLSRDLRVVLPEHLQSDEVIIEIRARDAAAVQRAAKDLAGIAQRDELAEIFALLREAP